MSKAGMMLMRQADRKRLPAIKSQEGKGFDAVVYLKLFCPYTGHRHYITEFDGCDTLFGYACAQEREWGYYSLAELQGCKVALGFGGRSAQVQAFERDAWFRPCTLREALIADGYVVEPATEPTAAEIAFAR